MTRVYLLLLLIYNSETKENPEKEQFCKEVEECRTYSDREVCGVRFEGEHFRMKIFPNECELLKYGCTVEEKDEYGIINMEYCNEATFLDDYKRNNTELENACIEDCPPQINNETICGIRKQGEGFKVQLFVNECELQKYNCKNNKRFEPTDHSVCNDIVLPKTESSNKPVECNKHCPAQDGNETICGMRTLGRGFKAQLFVNECELTKHNCMNNFTFYITDDFVCDGLVLPETAKTKDCVKKCPPQVGDETICGIKEHAEGYKVQLFVNDCEMKKHNCENNFNFNRTDHFVCSGLDLPKKTTPKSTIVNPQPQRRKNVIIVDAGMFGNTGDINETIENFFAGTHVFDMPLKDVSNSIDEATRRVLTIDLFKPIIVFQPWIHVPKVRKNDTWHYPLLRSCYHKCPTECPDVYAPVCGNPGVAAREPKLMFQNHCMMDAAQCKMKWEGETITSETSAYVEASFVFCMGVKLFSTYRFLPLIRTLQHMGRMKKKGRYHSQVRNMRFLNSLLLETPRIQG